MFFLKKHTCGTTDCVRCDEFGWWLTGSRPEPHTCEEILTSDGISVGSTQSMVTFAEAGDDYDDSFAFGQDSLALDEQKSSNDDRSDEPDGRRKLTEESSLEEDFSEDPSSRPEIPYDDPDEICLGEEPPCQTSSRSYTPERLVRAQDYVILTHSPTYSLTSRTETSTPGTTPCKRYVNKRNRRLNSLIDQQLVGASQLEALLDPNALDIKLPVALTRRKAFVKRSPPETKTTATCFSSLLAIANCDSPRRVLTPDLMSSGSSCDRLNYEWQESGAMDIPPRTAEGDPDYAFTLGNVSDCERLTPALQSLRDDSTSVEDLRDKVLTGDFDAETFEGPETVVRQLRGRIEHLQDINKDIFRDLSLLRKNFRWAEKKTGKMTSETTRLRQEIRDLRYLDDLVNLLQGELDRISQRNWPFNLGHKDHHTEELNLVV